MAGADVTILIDAKNNASTQLNKVKTDADGLQKSSLKTGDALKQLGLINIPGLEFLSRGFDAAKTSLEGYTAAAKDGTESLALYKTALVAVVAYAGFKLIEYLVDAKGAQEKLNEVLKESIAVYGEVARAKLELVGEQKFEAGLIRDPEMQMEAFVGIRDKLREEAEAAHKKVLETDLLYKKSLEQHGNFAALDKMFGLKAKGEDVLRSQLEGEQVAAKALTAELNKLNQEIKRKALVERTAKAEKIIDETKAQTDMIEKMERALDEQVNLFGASNHEAFQHSLMLNEQLTPASRKYQLALFDILEAKKADAEATKEMMKEQEKLKQELADPEGMTIRQREGQIRSILDRIRSEEEQRRGRLAQDAPELQAQESRALIRGGRVSNPAERTATATEKMTDELAALRAEQAKERAAAQKRLDEIAKALAGKQPEKVIDG